MSITINHQTNDISATSGSVTVDGVPTVKAHANYSSSGTVTLREGGNISSLSDNGTGNTQANFTNSFANDDWAAGLASVSAQVRLTSLASQSTTAIRLLTENDSGGNIDDSMVTFVIVGTLS